MRESWVSGHPVGREELAEWMGYRSVEDMDGEHDSIHRWLCDRLGVRSRSLAVGRGEGLSEEDWTLANCEEDVVLNLQRLIQRLRLIDREFRFSIEN